ncbi:MAG: tyrosine-protein phosphatase [Proteobacteria bacterium]|nr:tyrosine-protein phosphatase [Pseudomonadota bacterium]
MIARSHLSLFVHRAGIALLAALAVGGAYLGALQLSGNFHTVVAGEFYRSGQLSATQIARYAHEYGLKTIINLRGERARRPWYQAEVREANQLGISHVDFEMSARRELTMMQADALVVLMKRAKKPLLIHCEGGADRSGLASALYLARVARAGEGAAEAQLSIQFGHLPLPFIPEYAMDRTWEALEPSLGFPNS